MRLHRSWLIFLAVLPLLGLTLPLPAQAPATQQASAMISAPPVLATGQTREPPMPSKLAARRTATVQLVERARGAVVNIHSERTVKLNDQPLDVFALAPSQNRVNGMGTGIIIDPRGYIVTNHHVVEDVSVLRIRLADGTTTNATVFARSPDTDLALLKIDVGRPLPTITLGTADDLMVGEKVVAIGNAYGYEHTVSEGIVSAVKRDVSLSKDMSYKSLIQTDASINPGNSGGPLLNVHGELVGVNVAIRAGAQGIGFAIPVDSMIRTVGDLLRARRRAGSFDGLVVRDKLDPTPDGPVRSVIVERIESSSPAATAGLTKGDVLIKVGDMAIQCSYDLERALLDRPSGDHVPVVAKRANQEQRLNLVLEGSDRPRTSTGDLVWRKLGMKLTPVSADVVGRVNRQLHGGLEVVSINGEGPANRAGIRSGDILVGLHQWETVSMDNVVFVLSHADLASFHPLSFHIVRGGQVRRGWFQQLD